MCWCLQSESLVSQKQIKQKHTPGSSQITPFDVYSLVLMRPLSQGLLCKWHHLLSRFENCQAC